MQWIDKMNSVMDFVEMHIDGEIDTNEISRILACPFSVFQRTFVLLTGIQFSEYIRRRRLSCAAHDLRNTMMRVTDIAVKYGYESADAFAAAFKKMHGTPPSKAREPSAELKFSTKLSFALMVSGVTEMDYKVEKTGSRSFFGIRKKVPEGEKHFPYILGNARGQALQDYCGRLCNTGVCFGYDMEGNNDFMCAMEHFGGTEHGFDEYHYPPLTWLIFAAQGPISSNTIGKMGQRIYGEFLPQSRYKVLDLPIIEHYYIWDEINDHCHVEIRIPIQELTNEPLCN